MKPSQHTASGLTMKMKPTKRRWVLREVICVSQINSRARMETVFSSLVPFTCRVRKRTNRRRMNIHEEKLFWEANFVKVAVIHPTARKFTIVLPCNSSMP
jgi:hypothetical protein